MKPALTILWLLCLCYAAIAADVVLFRIGVDAFAYQTSGGNVVITTTTTTTTTTVPQDYIVGGSMAYGGLANGTYSKAGTHNTRDYFSNGTYLLFWANATDKWIINWELNDTPAITDPEVWFSGGGDTTPYIGLYVEQTPDTATVTAKP